MLLIADPKSFADELGNLHDAWIETLDISTAGEMLILGIDDLHANFRNPTPPGDVERPRRRATLIFEGATDLKLGIATATGLRIGALEIESSGEASRLVIALSQGGTAGMAEKWWITATFKSLNLSEAEL